MHLISIPLSTTQDSSSRTPSILEQRSRYQSQSRDEACPSQSCGVPIIAEATVRCAYQLCQRWGSLSSLVGRCTDLVGCFFFSPRYFEYLSAMSKPNPSQAKQGDNNNTLAFHRYKNYQRHYKIVHQKSRDRYPLNIRGLEIQLAKLLIPFALFVSIWAHF